MAFSKKIITIFICFVAGPSLWGMNKFSKFKFNKAVKNTSKNELFKAINKKFSLKKMSNFSFGTTYLKSMNWKKYATLGCLAGYGLWRWNESIASADSESKENNWDELSEQEKSLLADKYNESMWTYFFGSYLTSKNFKKASLSEQHAMIHAITRQLEQGHAVVDLEQIYHNSNEVQRNALALAIAEYFKQGHTVAYLDSIYKKSNEAQREIFIHVIAEHINQKNTQIKGLLEVYQYSNYQQKKILFSAVHESLEQGKQVYDLSNLYYYFDENHKNVLARDIANLLSEGQQIDCIGNIYENSNHWNQRFILVEGIANSLKQGHHIHRLANIYNVSNISQRDTLVEGIIGAISQEQPIHGLDQIYENSNQKQKDILLPCIITSLKQGKINDKVIVSIYKISNREQQRLLAFFFTPLLAAELNIDLNMISKTQTGGHILDNIGAVYFQLTEVTQLNKNNKKILQVVKNAIKSESNYAEKGNVVFYHAQMWEIFLQEFVYTTLSKIKHAQQAEHYFFTRFPFDGTCSENATLIQKERNIRKNLINYGRFDPYRPMLLFLNYALFGNTTNRGSSSFHYFVYNFNVTNPGISSRDVFAQFGLEAFYDNNKEEIEALEQQFLQLTRHGNLLQIAIPKEHLKKHLYLTTTGGPKIKAQIKKDVFNYAYNKKGEIVDVIENRIMETDDVIELIKTLKSNPQTIVDSDQKEFVWIVTADTLQKAIQDGVEIKSFNTADPEELKQVTNKLTNLLATKLAGHWVQPEPTPWKCYKMHKQK